MPGAMKYTKAKPAQAAIITHKPCCSVIFVLLTLTH